MFSQELFAAIVNENTVLAELFRRRTYFQSAIVGVFFVYRWTRALNKGQTTANKKERNNGRFDELSALNLCERNRNKER